MSFRSGKYDLDFKNPASDPATYLESSKLAELYQEFIKEFPMVSIEDPFDQDDWEAWTSLTANTTIQVNQTIKWKLNYFTTSIIVLLDCW